MAPIADLLLSNIDIPYHCSQRQNVAVEPSKPRTSLKKCNFLAQKIFVVGYAMRKVGVVLTDLKVNA